MRSPALLMEEEALCRAPPAPYGGGAELTRPAVVVGLAVGTVLCFTNMCFGLQTGWARMLCEEELTREAGRAPPHQDAQGLFAPAECTPIVLSWPKQLLWAAALCYFGIFFAVPLRRQTIVVEQLRFPS
eukprot:gene28726-13152_t